MPRHGRKGPTVFTSLKVAVADDQPELRDWLRGFIEREGHQAAAAEDGDDLVSLCREFRPDAVVTDWQMPGADGLEAAAEVNRERFVPVVLISGSPGAEQAASAAGGFVVGCLVKPVNPAKVIGAIQRAAPGGTVAGPR